MPGINVDIEIYCSCVAGLCNNTSEGRTTGRNQPFFIVEPCEKCSEFATEIIKNMELVEA